MKYKKTMFLPKKIIKSKHNYKGGMLIKCYS